jgi:hypothetical protein
MEALLPILWSFVSLDRVAAEPRVGVEVETTIALDRGDYDGTPVDLLATRLDLFGELPVCPCRRWGVTGRLPLTLVRFLYSGSSAREETQLGVGALSLGGYHVFDVATPGLALRARLDVVLPTDDFQGTYDPSSVRDSLLWSRLEEPVDDRGSAWLRGGLVGRYQRGPWTAQADAFVKVAFERQLEADYYDQGQEPIGSLGLGLGRELGPLQATAELVVAELPLAHGEALTSWDELTDRTLATATVSLGGHVGELELRGHFTLPLDRYYREHTFLLGLGATYRR